MHPPLAPAAGATDLDAAQTPLGSKSFGRYRILSLIAQGGMAKVWLAEAEGEAGFRKRVVLKTMLPTYGANELFVKMFIEEANLAAHFEHDNIVRVFDFGIVEQTHFIAMEYIAGRTLRQMVSRAKRRNEPLELWFFLRVLASTCDALDYVHRYAPPGAPRPLGLLHRDVSPENVMVSVTGTVKLLDFGVAHASINESRKGLVVGKYRYMAPERLHGDSGAISADLYSIGLMLYEFLVGHALFKPNDERPPTAIVVGGVPPIRTVLPSLDSQLADIIDVATALDPAQRYQSAARLARHLRRQIARLGPDALHRSLAPVLAHLFSDAEELARAPQPQGDECHSVAAAADAVMDEIEVVINDPPVEGQFAAPPPAFASSPSGVLTPDIESSPRLESFALPPADLFTPTIARSTSVDPPSALANDLFASRPSRPALSSEHGDPFSVRGSSASTAGFGLAPRPSASVWSPSDWGFGTASLSPPEVHEPPPRDVPGAREFDLGLERLRRRDYDSALTLWQTALARDPHNRTYQANLKRLQELIKARTP